MESGQFDTKRLQRQATQYLEPLTRVADLPRRRSLHSVGINRLGSASCQAVNVGSRSFPVVNPQIWNDLPEAVTSAELLSTFRRRLKLRLFT